MNKDQMFKDIIWQIEADTKASNEQLRTDDLYLIGSANKAQLDCDPEYDERNRLYTELLGRYISDYKSKAAWKKWYKLIFFIVTLISFLGIIAVSLAALILVTQKAPVTFADLGTVLGSIAGILSALLVIPKIIAEHLFPTNEDSYMIEMVKNMQLNDSAIRKLLDKEK